MNLTKSKWKIAVQTWPPEPRLTDRRQFGRRQWPLSKTNKGIDSRLWNTANEHEKNRKPNGKMCTIPRRGSWMASALMENCFTSSVIRNRQLKTARRCWWTKIQKVRKKRQNVSEEVGESKHPISFHARGQHWASSSRKTGTQGPGWALGR